MKRYLAFIGNHYYPVGGMGDFEGDFDSLEESQFFIEEKVNKEKNHPTIEEQWEYTWAHIWDTESRNIVWSK